MQKYKSSLIWFSLGLLAVLVRTFSGPQIIESIYSRGLFIVIRWVYDIVLTWLPFVALYLFIPLVLYFIFNRIRRLWFAEGPRWERALQFLVGTLGFLGAVVFFFLVVWGFNYGRVAVEKQMGFEPIQPELDVLEERLHEEVAILDSLRQLIPGATDSALVKPFRQRDLERELRAGLKTQLRKWGYPAPGRVRGKLIYPKGIFLRFSSSGLYFPFTAEGQVDAGLLPLQRPAVLAHEMTHGMGFGDEGTCSFWAWLVCIHSENPAIAYCGRLSYYRSLAIAYLRYRREEYQAFRTSLPVGIQSDLNAINANLLAYPDIMPEVRYVAYDTYLKAQGIAEGMLNYSRVIKLVEGYRAKYGSVSN